MKFINLHTHQFVNQENILEIVNQYPSDFNESTTNYSIGIHPWHINIDNLETELSIINQKLLDKNCLALGECGLDKRIKIPLDLQIEIFEKQIQLALIHKKPLILHCVAAFQEIIEIKKRLKVNVPMIIHEFSKNIQLANQLLDNGFYLSFGKYLIQSQSLGTDFEMVFEQIPSDKFFLETDSSDYAIEDIYLIASKLKKIEIEDLKTICCNNFNQVFKNNNT